MALYKYGMAFLAGTGFGAAMTTLRNSRCPLHKHDSCSCHRHRRRHSAGGAGESPADQSSRREREEYYEDEDDAQGQGQGKGKRCQRKGGKEKKAAGDKSEESSD